MQDYVASRKEAQKSRKRRKILLYAAAVLCIALCTGLVFFLRSALFRVTDITISETNTISRDEIISVVRDEIRKKESFLRDIFGKDNILFIGTEGLASTLKEKYPAIKDIQTEKNIGRKIISFNIQEREKTALWCTVHTENGKSCVWFDREGVPFMDGLQVEGKILYQIEDRSVQPIALGTPILPEKEMATIFKIYSFLESVSWNTRTIVIDNRSSGEAYTLATENLPKLQFSLSNDPSYAKDAMQKLSKKDLEYIDLRVPDRIYYK